MAYAAATTSQFKTRFPAFAAVSDVIVQMGLDEALSRVSDEWNDLISYQTGQMLYAAHVLSLDGFGTSGDAIAFGALAGVTRYKTDGLEVERKGQASSGSGGWTSGLYWTSYGRRYLDLLRMNVIAVKVIA